MTALDQRYGRTGRRRGRAAAVVGAIALAVLVAAWALWTGLGGAFTSLDLRTTAVEVQDDRTTTVSWLVTGRADDALICAVEARDVSGAVVGLVEEALPVAGRPDRSGTTQVRTVRRAATGLIASCRDA